MIRSRPTTTYWICCDVCHADASDEDSLAMAEARNKACSEDGFVRTADGRDLCGRCADTAPEEAPLEFGP